jgi:DNA-binding NarL/FixJ family response regulator
MSTGTGVIIADDHPIFRKGLAEVINSSGSFRVIEQVDNGRLLIQQTEKFHPEIVVVDVNMPVLDGIEAARKIRSSFPDIKVIILTMKSDRQVMNAALEIGVYGYILKDNAIEDVIKCIEAVHRGEMYISPALTGLLVHQHNKHKQTLEKLTPSERKIFEQIGKCKTSKEIAEAIHVSIKTVENHRANICKKLELKGKNSLLKFALYYYGSHQ